MLLLSILWGSSFFFIAVAVREWPPLSIVLARVSIAAVQLWLIILAVGPRPRLDRSALVASFGMGLLNNVLPFVLIVLAQQSLPSGTASIFNATTPLFGVLVAGAAGVERITPPRLIGVLAGLGGVVAMAGADPLATPWPAALCMLGATFLYALAGLWGRRFKALGMTPVQAAAGQTSASTLMLLPLVLLLEVPPLPSLEVAGALLGLATLCTTGGYFMYFLLLNMVGPVNMLLVTLIIPVTSFVLGALFLNESLAPRHLLGMAGVALGLALIDGRLMRRLPRWRNERP
ncbi:DMT family transporter [Rhodovarius crocodyli]|uniref:DMT family transporter n=2 Tax=Rhodovarius crocodyli TaxID=1979269 RepID=A0A437LZ27_9PROT|nr:DMT family transporter [Rhodovarius crocodyli]